MHKSMYEEVTGEPYQLDARDRDILDARRARWEARQDGPRVGDYLLAPPSFMPTLRFTHDWGDGIQTTAPKFGGGSFYLSESGHMDYSGCLDPGIPKDTVELVPGATVNGPCWFFSHGYATAHNGVTVAVPCRVYRVKGGGAAREAQA